MFKLNAGMFDQKKKRQAKVPYSDFFYEI